MDTKVPKVGKNALKRLMFALALAVIMVAPAAAYETNGSITDIIPVLNDIVLLFGPILNMVIAIMPISIAMTFIGFIGALLTAIVYKMKIM